MLTFVFCFLSFSVPLILGGYQYVTIEVDIFSTIVTLLDFRTGGAALAIIQLSLSVLFMYFYLKALDAYSKREEQRIMRKPKKLAIRSILSLKGGFGIVLYSIFVVVFILAPLGAILYDSLRFNGTWSLEWYRRVFSTEYNPMFGTSTLGAIKNSLLFGFATVFFSTLVGLPIAYFLNRWKFRGGKVLLDALAMLPLASSPITIGFAYVKFFSTTPLYYTIWIVVIAHTIIAYPFVLRAVSTALKKIKPNLREPRLASVLVSGRPS